MTIAESPVEATGTDQAVEESGDNRIWRRRLADIANESAGALQASRDSFIQLLAAKDRQLQVCQEALSSCRLELKDALEEICRLKSRRQRKIDSAFRWAKSWRVFCGQVKHWFGFR